MNELFDQISADIKTAMLAREKVTLEALRGIKKEFIEAKTAKGSDGNLSDEAAIKILQMDADMLCTQIARELSVSFHIVWKIRSGKTWKHLSTSASPQ